MHLEPENKLIELKQKHKQISDSAIKLNTQIENAQDNYKKLQALALSKFGTSDVEELKNLLVKWTEQNAESLNNFEKEINQLEFEVNSKNNLIKQIQQS